MVPHKWYITKLSYHVLGQSYLVLIMTWSSAFPKIGCIAGVYIYIYIFVYLLEWNWIQSLNSSWEMCEEEDWEALFCLEWPLCDALWSPRLHHFSLFSAASLIHLLTSLQQIKVASALASVKWQSSIQTGRVVGGGVDILQLLFFCLLFLMSLVLHALQVPRPQREPQLLF